MQVGVGVQAEALQTAHRGCFRGGGLTSLTVGPCVTCLNIRLGEYNTVRALAPTCGRPREGQYHLSGTAVHLLLRFSGRTGICAQVHVTRCSGSP